MKYTEDDIIKSTLDCRLENARGRKCIVGNNVNNLLDRANDSPDHFDKVLVDIIADSKTPFVFRDCIGVYHSSYIIFKKEPEKKIVPFDFSLKEDRDALMGKRIKTNAEDMIVTAFAYWISKGWQIQVDSKNGFDGEYVFKNFVFADGENKGKPVGKEVIDGD